MTIRTLTLSAVAVLLALAFGCTQSAVARRKEAQANGDKYLEFLKANDAEGAYRNTFSTVYQSQQSLETWIRYRQGMSRVTGPILNYQVVKYDAPENNPRVSLTYAIQTANMKDPVLENIKLEREGSEWKIVSVEPQFTTPPPPPPPTGALPLPKSGANPQSPQTAPAPALPAK